jgi:hypothetical protein
VSVSSRDGPRPRPRPRAVPHTRSDTTRAQVVTSLADPSANIIFGAVVDPAYDGEVRARAHLIPSSSHPSARTRASAASL